MELKNWVTLNDKGTKEKFVISKSSRSRAVEVADAKLLYIIYTSRIQLYTR